MALMMMDYILKPETTQQLFNDEELSVALFQTTDMPEEESNSDEIAIFTKATDMVFRGVWPKASSFRYLKHKSEILPDDYRKGLGFWGGAYNTHFSIHPKFGYGIVSFHQFVPYGDEEVYRLYFMVEQEVHKAIIQEKR
jgi:hypothetical protein